MEMADVMYVGGYRDAGYQYVCIDVGISNSKLQWCVP